MEHTLAEWFPGTLDCCQQEEKYSGNQERKGLKSLTSAFQEKSHQRVSGERVPELLSLGVAQVDQSSQALGNLDMVPARIEITDDQSRRLGGGRITPVNSPECHNERIRAKLGKYFRFWPSNS